MRHQLARATQQPHADGHGVGQVRDLARDVVDGLELGAHVLAAGRRAELSHGLRHQSREGLDELRLLAAERLHLQAIDHHRPAHHARRPHGHRQQGPDLHLARVVREAPEEPLEVGGVEALAALEQERERVALEVEHPVAQQRRRPVRRAQVGPVGLAVEVEAEHRVRVEGCARGGHDARQPEVQLGRALGLARAATLLRDLAQPRPRRGSRELAVAVFLEMVDAVLHAGQLGQRRAQAAFLAAQRLVDGEDQRAPAQRRGDDFTPGREAAVRGVGGDERRGQGGQAEARGRRLRHRDRREEQGEHRPDRPSQRPRDLSQAVQAQHEEHVERELLRGAAAAQAGQQRGGGHAQAQEERDGEAKARGGARRQRPHESDGGHRRGGGEHDLPGPPADPQVEDGTAVGALAQRRDVTARAGADGSRR